MKTFSVLLLVLGMFAIGGCTKTSPVLTPIQDAGCAIESAVTGGFAGAVSAALQCTNAGAVQASLQAAFGNANLCAQQTAVTTAMAAKKAQLASGGKAPMGLVGNIACPIAVSSALGFLSNSVPNAWGCSSGASISALSTALIAACEIAIPI